MFQFIVITYHSVHGASLYKMMTHDFALLDTMKDYKSVLDYI